MEPSCVKCGSTHVIKNGSVRGIPKKKCQTCGYQFTKNIVHVPRGMPLRIKLFAVWLYISGLSMNRISKLLNVSAQSVLNWIRQYAREQEAKPQPSGKAIIVEVDEMWHYLKKNSDLSGSGKLWMVIQDSCLTGNVGIVIEQPS
ncbi:MAG: hypothetical protein KatS3mg131_2990 [Candidatus Tectimicrobiota bacterium]|nr:MAG: hypothetical protein KatS3mg131_2990 [Candidatus Tectomicrobia bacterium]